MRLSALVCTANFSAIGDGEWAMIAPFGDHDSPDGSYVQRFSRDQAGRIVKSWNSITGTAARTFKNLWHGLGAKASLPVWDGHPETDKRRWPVEKLLAEITDLRVGDHGLEGRVTWNAQGLSRRTHGPLFPSPLWWHWPPSGEPPAVFPELLESIGLVQTPNISSVPAWTQNTTFAGTPPADNPHEELMNQEELNALREALATANAARAALENQLTTANSEIDSLREENAQRSTLNAQLSKGLLDIAEKSGAFSPAERGRFESRLATANTFDTALAELQSRRPLLNTTPVEINGNRLDLSTSNSRHEALNAAVARRMKEEKCDRDTAFARVMADPQLKPLRDAMGDANRNA